MLLFMKHCNDFDPCGPSIGQYNSYSYVNCMPLEGPKLVNQICLCLWSILWGIDFDQENTLLHIKW
jgi:hypothetical protein